jgi:hypothetical protein
MLAVISAAKKQPEFAAILQAREGPISAVTGLSYHLPTL